MSDAAQRLSSARARVNEVSRLLLAPSPAALDRCLPLLEEAILNLKTCLPEVAHAATDPPAFQAACGLQASVRHARRLLDGAAEYHEKWVRRLGALSTGYTGRGEPGTVDRGARMLLEG